MSNTSGQQTHEWAVLALTKSERGSLIACLNGELDNDDEDGDEYMEDLRRIVQKLS